MKDSLYFLAFVMAYMVASGGIVFNSVIMHEMAHAAIYRQLGNCNSTIIYQFFKVDNFLLAQTVPENCSYPNAEYYAYAKVLNQENEIVGYNQQSTVFAILVAGFFIFASIWFLASLLLRKEEPA